jgi:uncharacterized protein (DUF302 family)/uncharacterized membrane protein YidH (DUF202 family)
MEIESSHHRNMEMQPNADLRDYLAAERTVLAWIRTALSLMGFGFVVARFGLFLQELQVSQRVPALQHYGMSLWFGTALIAAGVVVNLLSGLQHARLIRTLNQDRDMRPRSTTLALATSLFLALVGIGMAIYLISVRYSENPRPGNIEATLMVPNTNNGIVSKQSKHTVDETLENLTRTLETKGVTVFAIVDHSGEAEKVGLKMRPAKLVIFGNPKAGTPLMLAAPSIAIDLPLKILVSEDEGGKVWISYNSPDYLEQRHGVPADLLQNIANVETLANKAAE